MAAVPAESSAPDFAEIHGVTLEALCTRLYERHQAQMDVRKPATAVANLMRIVGATLALAERGSFHEMSMRDLSRESGLSLGALYTYIQDKAGLLDLMLDGVTDAVERVLIEPEETTAIAPADPHACLERFIDRHVRLTEAMPAWFTFAYMEARAFGPQARARVKAAEMQTETLILDILHAGCAQGDFRLQDPVMTAALIKPLLQDWYLKRWKYRARGVTPDAYIAALLDFIEQGLAGPDRPTPAAR
ncbi:TetR/AcrR family transcriptional regulator [Aquibaculum arenosum]|uniref:TetR/AcrR family transcriptional regulator n=1 Tax=Aquibaculum arenosum TaxID=3032591 RepID=A0ABT5YMG9_9PROT|nr:TetR/AcrR family transcriptional regulator [Fodinicurvata sp. CAU 1616]MDF2096042.1 TetR/AcrR family transcriptional regulator [Fodinicurvata sp. CAU 1616]